MILPDGHGRYTRSPVQPKVILLQNHDHWLSLHRCLQSSLTYCYYFHARHSHPRCIKTLETRPRCWLSCSKRSAVYSTRCGTMLKGSRFKNSNCSTWKNHLFFLQFCKCSTSTVWENWKSKSVSKRIDDSECQCNNYEMEEEMKKREGNGSETRIRGTIWVQ